MARTFLKAVAIGAAGLLLAGAALGAGWFAKSDEIINRVHPVDPPRVPVTGDSPAVERGRHLVQGVLGCTGCHGEDLGGGVVVDAPPFMRLAAPNLTRGSGGSAPRLGDTDWVRAIRHGVRADGRALAVMPSQSYRHLSDADLGAVIAFLQRLAPVDRALPTRLFGPIARFQLARGVPLFRAAEIDHAAARSVSAPPPGVTVGYGRYLANIAGCTDCHGPALAGGPIALSPPGTPSASNLTLLSMSGWTEADFARALREGRGSGGRLLNEFMPYRFMRFTDDEIRALWMFVRSLPPGTAPPTRR